MHKPHGFRPTADELEARVVLSHSPLRGPSVLVAGLTPRVQGLGRHASQAILPLINKAFDSFVQDYSQARATYLSTLASSSTTGTSAKAAFANYTHYRVELLAQQVVSSSLQTTLSNSKQRGSGPSLPMLVGRYIDGKKPDETFKPGTLGFALTESTPDASSSQAAAALDSLAQDQAVASARVGVLNGLNIIRNGDFGNVSTPNH